MVIVNLKIPDSEAVVQIQTPFGGGKTHVLIDLFHLLAQWIDLSFTLYYTFSTPGPSWSRPLCGSTTSISTLEVICRLGWMRWGSIR